MKKGLPFAGAFLAVVLAGPTTSNASDHVDGIKTGIDLAADITDLYSFTSPRDPNKVVFVMNTHGLAWSGSRFSNAVDYKIRIRPVDPATMKPRADGEQSMVCTFTGGTFLINGNQRATCKLSFGNGSEETVVFDTRGAAGIKAGGIGQKNDIKVFAGVRSDTWFLDLGKVITLNKGEAISNGAGSNGLQGHNILSIVVEMDKRRLSAPMVAVTAQTVRK
jgi:hypothetical protein